MDYNFSNNGEYKITETIGYPTYNLQRKRSLVPRLINDTSSHPNAQSSSFIFNNSEVDNNYYISSENDLCSNIKNNNKRVILVDDEQDILFTYRDFLKDYNYEITSFTESFESTKLY